jgi:hypothetical protein
MSTLPENGAIILSGSVFRLQAKVCRLPTEEICHAGGFPSDQYHVGVKYSGTIPICRLAVSPSSEFHDERRFLQARGVATTCRSIMSGNSNGTTWGASQTVSLHDWN